MKIHKTIKEEYRLGDIVYLAAMTICCVGMLLAFMAILDAIKLL